MKHIIIVTLCLTCSLVFSQKKKKHMPKLLLIFRRN